MTKKDEECPVTLYHRRAEPQAVVEILADDAAFQGYRVIRLSEAVFPLPLGGQPVILDFGEHRTGYLHFSLSGDGRRIADSPTRLRFSFAEMPIELMETVEDSPETLSVSWLQNEERSYVFLPCEGALERRYAFRYVKIERTDPLRFPVLLQGMWADAVSALDLTQARPLDMADPLLRRIDEMCLRTLAECAQEVFEDGPKRDRRLWIGDLRLQALVDYAAFGDPVPVRRCLRLFAEHPTVFGTVASCIFPQSPPYVDEWFFLDYSLCFGLCLDDYRQNTGDMTLTRELYPVALAQVDYAASVFDRESGAFDALFFIDHGKYDRGTAALGYFSYALRRMDRLAEALGRPMQERARLAALTADSDRALLARRDGACGLFLAAGGEVSWQSQIWAALSGALPTDEARALLIRTAEVDPPIRPSSPFMMHYQLEALDACGMTDEMLMLIRGFWGQIVDAGFDCCPECFDPKNERVTPYASPVLNSACHAWSCTPSYWLRRMYR